MQPFDKLEEVRIPSFAEKSWFAPVVSLTFLPIFAAACAFLGLRLGEKGQKDCNPPEIAPKTEFVATPPVSASKKEPEVTTNWRENELAKKAQRELLAKEPSEPTP